MAQLLFTAQVTFSDLYGRMAEEELDLIQFASCEVAEDVRKFGASRGEKRYLRTTVRLKESRGSEQYHAMN